MSKLRKIEEDIELLFKEVYETDYYLKWNYYKK